VALSQGMGGSGVGVDARVWKTGYGKCRELERES
jgi:hypothetical protein